jgi:hypothetical protein
MVTEKVEPKFSPVFLPAPHSSVPSPPLSFSGSQIPNSPLLPQLFPLPIPPSQLPNSMSQILGSNSQLSSLATHALSSTLLSNLNPQLHIPTSSLPISSNLSQPPSSLSDIPQFITPNTSAITDTHEVKAHTTDLDDKKKNQAHTEVVSSASVVNDRKPAKVPVIKDEFENISADYITKITTIIQQENAKLLQKYENDRKAREDAQKLVLTQFLKTQLAGELEKILEKLTKDVLIPTITETISNHLEEKIKKNYAQMVVPRIEVSIKENLEKHASQTTRVIVGESFKDNFNGVLAPSFDHSCRDLFIQLAENLEKSFKKQQTVQPRQQQIKDNVLPEAITIAHQLLEVAQKLSGTITNSHTALKSFSEQRDEFPGEERDSYKRSVEQSKEFTKPVDIKSKVLQFIKDKDYDSAFSTVLSELDLSLISWLVSTVEPFGQTNLSQSVIISIIQQLTCSPTLDLTKLEWLHYCLTELDPKDAIIAPYVTDVLSQLHIKITTMNETTDPSKKDEGRLVFLITKYLNAFRSTNTKLIV